MTALVLAALRILLAVWCLVIIGYGGAFIRALWLDQHDDGLTRTERRERRRRDVALARQRAAQWDRTTP